MFHFPAPRCSLQGHKLCEISGQKCKPKTGLPRSFEEGRGWLWTQERAVTGLPRSVWRAQVGCGPRTGLSLASPGLCGGPRLGLDPGEGCDWPPQVCEKGTPGTPLQNGAWLLFGQEGGTRPCLLDFTVHTSSHDWTGGAMVCSFTCQCVSTLLSQSKLPIDACLLSAADEKNMLLSRGSSYCF